MKVIEIVADTSENQIGIWQNDYMVSDYLLVSYIVCYLFCYKSSLSLDFDKNAFLPQKD